MNILRLENYKERRKRNRLYLSKIMTVSAVARFNPSPPARVDKRKMKYGESGALNMYIRFSRSSAVVDPSRRIEVKPRYAK